MDNEFHYIGDGVYIRFDGYGYILHINSHENPTDKVYLEPSVLKALIDFTKIAVPTRDTERND